MRHCDLLIDGERIATDDTRDVTSPYTGEVVGTVAVAGVRHADRAVDAAAAALRAGAPPQHERAAVLERTRALVAERAEDFARSIALEAGKPIATARAEVARCQDTLLFAAVEARKLSGHMVPFEASPQGAGKLGFTVHHPKGVVAAISPFNFPLNLVCHKLAPAFAAGCPVVLKPAGNTPLTAYLLAETLLEAGMPPGFLHVLTGPSSDIGPAVTGRQEVAVVSFTGSTSVGHQLAADNPDKSVLLELGNNTPVLVDASADLELAAGRIAVTGFSYAGQSCISAQRVLVHAQAKEAFVDGLLARVAELRTGDPLEEGTDVGPLIRPNDRDRVMSWIDEAVGEGATLLAGGAVNDDGTLQPTVLDEVRPDMKVSCEEVFGPVLAIQTVSSMDEAVELANHTRYGLQAGIFTGDLASALLAARRLVFGGVTINESPTFRADQQPYGGVRDSGNTREGPAYAIRDYLDETAVIVSHS